MDLDFSAKATPITLEGLRRSIVEKHPNGEAVGGISHVNLIEDVLEMFERKGIKAKMTDLFAANNRDKYRPGVTIDKYRAAQMEELGYEAVMIRRLFANIDLGICTHEGTALKCVISYSQRGIQVAFGPEVQACRNLCILRARDVFSTYQLGRPSLMVEATYRQVDDLLLHIDNYIASVEQENMEMGRMISMWAHRQMTKTLYCHLLFTLMTMRVEKDTKDGDLHRNVTYALNSSQINACHEEALRQTAGWRDSRTATMWDAYNWMNRLFKPEQMDTPSIVPQSLALTEAFQEIENIRV